MPELDCADHPVLGSRKEAASEFIISTLASLDLHPQIMPFSSLLGRGFNIFVDIMQDEVQPMRLVGAHYDGAELHDNLGGVLALLDAATHLLEIETRHSWRIAFWDAEETFQQGSRFYAEQTGQLKSTGSGERLRVIERHTIYVDIDGLGLGESVFARSASESSSKVGSAESNECIFLMDCDVFQACDIPSFHIFTGPHEYENIYKESGLGGCHRLIHVNTLDTERNFRESMPSSLMAMRRLVSAWEGMPFETAVTEAGITWLR